jgi:branched-subunit amino acid transport protein
VSGSAAWQLIAGCAAVTAAIKATGPVALGGRDLPAWFAAVIRLMAPALLAALVCSSALADGRHLAVGADTAGVAAGGALLWRGGSIVLAVILAAAVTAALRAL